MHRLASLVFLAALAGCSSPTTPTDSGSDASAPVDASIDAGNDAARVPQDANVDAVLPEDAGPHAHVTITDFFVGGNCMPIVPPDPIIAGWTAHVSGASGTSATLTSATLHLVPTSGTAFTQTLTVDVTSIPLSGGTGMAMQSKTGGAPAPMNACSTLCDANATLDLVLTIDGAAVPASATGTLGCAF